MFRGLAVRLQVPGAVPLVKAFGVCIGVSSLSVGSGITVCLLQGHRIAPRSSAVRSRRHARVFGRVSADCDCRVTDDIVTLQTFPTSHALVTLGRAVRKEEEEGGVACKVDVGLDHAGNSGMKPECMRAMEQLWMSQCYRPGAPGGSVYK